MVVIWAHLKLQTTFFCIYKQCVVWSKTTLNYWVMVKRHLNLKEEVGGFPAVKSPLDLTDYLSGGQLPLVLWCWHVGLLSPKNKINCVVVVAEGIS